MSTHVTPPADDTGDDHARLPCGRLISELWDRWERQEHDAHLTVCEHCRHQVEDLERLESAVHGLREATEPEGADVTALTRRVMDVVRLELRPGRPIPLGDPWEDLSIMEAVAARSLREAAETIPGVHAGSCRLELTPRAPEVAVRIEVHAPAHGVLPEIADRIRAAVRAAATSELGMSVSAVDILISDLVGPADGQEERES
ncbi:Asp23/Gls24 family envelope stress response protein [Streptomyces sp. NBC_00691]|uniref:Asp23/Gls24 family envelope stress response protein n=1 Tax=Streptomyces sp. NBC_00691 TaxID=2903671 RepID=UPI002E35C79C|nr:Asp23/Gls24 family envelope stress response protein [Streptomyces sp. NBC_00691]